jgi:hypothetical protein
MVEKVHIDGGIQFLVVWCFYRSRFYVFHGVFVGGFVGCSFLARD